MTDNTKIDAQINWESAVDSIDDIVMLVDNEGRITGCNKAMADFIGRVVPDILDKEWQSLLYDNGIRFNENNCCNARRDIEVLNEPKGGWFTIKIYPHRASDSGEPAGAVIIIQDTTQMKALAESLEITNAALEKDRYELQLALDEITFLMRDVEKNMDIGVRFRTSDFSGSDFIYRIGEHFNRMMDMLESKHKELEKAYADLKTAEIQMLQSEKMASIGQLAAGVAHEINNPMGFIISNLNTLAKYTGRMFEFIKVQSEEAGQSDEMQKKLNEAKRSFKLDYIIEDTGSLIRESLDGAERVKRIVQNLKSFSHIDEAEYKPADINECIESTINMVWNELKYKANVKKEYGDIPMTKCNPGQLNQVFMNMLVNAAHAIEKQGDITVKTWSENNNICVSISDNGCGIPLDRIGRIFEPFFTTKEVGKGTGLGLSIAYDIVKKHNGEITVESEVGKGTTFTVKIPVVEG